MHRKGKMKGKDSYFACCFFFFFQAGTEMNDAIFDSRVKVRVKARRKGIADLDLSDCGSEG